MSVAHSTPTPDGPDPGLAWWQVAIEVAGFLAIVAGVLAPWHRLAVGALLAWPPARR